MGEPSGGYCRCGANLRVGIGEQAAGRLARGGKIQLPCRLDRSGANNGLWRRKLRQHE
jgi:hypothetical protein